MLKRQIRCDGSVLALMLGLRHELTVNSSMKVMRIGILEQLPTHRTGPQSHPAQEMHRGEELLFCGFQDCVGNPNLHLTTDIIGVNHQFRRAPAIHSGPIDMAQILQRPHRQQSPTYQNHGGNFQCPGQAHEIAIPPGPTAPPPGPHKSR